MIVGSKKDKGPERDKENYLRSAMNDVIKQIIKSICNKSWIDGKCFGMKQKIPDSNN
jgi:chemotaxis receptor (MCP) glutamine deamidase CheD